MSERPMTADILSPNPGPPLSATSDMPILDAAPAAENGAADAPPPPADGQAAAEQTPPAEGEGGTDGEAGEGQAAEPTVDGEPPPAEPAKKPRQGINERFSDLTTAKKAAEAEAKAQTARAESAERALQEALARIPKAEDKPAPVIEPPPPPEPRPLRESFNTPEEYDDALIAWTTSRTLATARAEQEQHAKSEKETADRAAAETANQQSLKTIVDTHAARVEAAKAKYPDYAEVAERDDLKISLPMAMAIMQSDDGPDAAHYLGEHPEVAERISALVVPNQFYPRGHALAGQPVPDAQRQWLEMGRVFAAVAQPTSPPPPPEPPPLPAPITPIRGGRGGGNTMSLADLGNEGSMDDYAARRLPELQAERRPGVFGGGTKPH